MDLGFRLPGSWFFVKAREGKRGCEEVGHSLHVVFPSAVRGGAAAVCPPSAAYRNVPLSSPGND